MEYRMEHDSMGEVRVPADKYWGAQTERSHENFPIGVGLETMPREITRAFGVLKLAAARANHVLKPEKMTKEKLTAIEKAAIYRETLQTSANADQTLEMDVTYYDDGSYVLGIFTSSGTEQ